MVVPLSQKERSMLGKVYDDYYQMVKRIASEYSNKFKMVDREDIAQQLWLWFAEHPNKTEEWMAMDNQKDSDKLFARSLRNAALDFCVKEKSIAEGYHYDDIFWYTKEFIKLTIPAVLSDDWTRLSNVLSSEGKSLKSLAESGDWMAFVADINSAFNSLTEKEQNLVFLFYAQDVDGEDLHEQVGEESATKRATMMQANRALDKMVRALGGTMPFIDEDFTKKEDDTVDMSQVS